MRPHRSRRRAAWGHGRPPYAPAGAVQNKITDAAGAEKMTFHAALGHACGMNFKASEHLAKHPEFAWMREILRDMPARGLGEVFGEMKEAQ